MRSSRLVFVIVLAIACLVFTVSGQNQEQKQKTAPPVSADDFEKAHRAPAPRAPMTMEETGLAPDQISHLFVKTLYTGEATGVEEFAALSPDSVRQSKARARDCVYAFDGRDRYRSGCSE